MNVVRPALSDRPLDTPFQISTMRGHPVYAYYTVRISCPVSGTGLLETTSAQVALLVDATDPPAASSTFGTVALTKTVTLPIGTADQDDVVQQVGAIVAVGQWVELRSTVVSGSPVIEILDAIEVEV